MKSTFSLFERFHSNLPPLFPEVTKQQIIADLDRLREVDSIDLPKIENIMVSYGYEAWPWNKAYQEHLKASEERVADHFVSSKLNSSTAERYEDFKLYGGTYRDLHSGRSASFFTPEEQAEIRDALVSCGTEVKDFTNREIVGAKKAKFLQRVGELQKNLSEIKQILGVLRNMAESEDDFPSLKNEIHARIKAFEHGLCLLGPEQNHAELPALVDHFRGRKEELRRLSTVF